jgi:hypothetical protein
MLGRRSPARRLELARPIHVLPKLGRMVFCVSERHPDARILTRATAKILDHRLDVTELLLRSVVKFYSRSAVGLRASPKRFPLCIEVRFVLSQKSVGRNGVSLLELVVRLDERGGLADIWRQKPVGALPAEPETKACNCEADQNRNEHVHDGYWWRPNGSRLSCGRNASGRKEVELRTKRLASEATQFLPACERPSASSAC